MTRQSVLRLLLPISVAVISVVGSAANAQRAAALVLDKSGVSTPNVESYTEIPAGTTITLGAGAKVVFQHYRSCRTVTVVGGTIRFDVDTYSITGGTKQEQQLQTRL